MIYTEGYRRAVGAITEYLDHTTKNSKSQKKVKSFFSKSGNVYPMINKNDFVIRSYGTKFINQNLRQGRYFFEAEFI